MSTPKKQGHMQYVPDASTTKQSPGLGTIWLDVEQVCAKLSISRSSLYRHLRAGELPPPARINARVARWNAASIDAAMTKKVGGSK